MSDAPNLTRPPGDENDPAVQAWIRQWPTPAEAAQAERDRAIARQAAQMEARANSPAARKKAEEEEAARKKAERRELESALAVAADQFDSLPVLTPVEEDDLTELHRQAQQAVSGAESAAARKAITTFQDAIGLARTDAKKMTDRLAFFLDKNIKDGAKAAYDQCIAANVKFPTTYNIKLRQLGIIQRTQVAPNFAKIDSRAGERHAWERHTKEGIWHQKAVESDYEGDVVSIFPTETALANAVAAIPLARKSWWVPRKFPDRLDTTIGGVHYQADGLGDTIALRTCHPARGREEYDKAGVIQALNDAQQIQVADEDVFSKSEIDALQKNTLTPREKGALQRKKQQATEQKMFAAFCAAVDAAKK